VRQGGAQHRAQGQPVRPARGTRSVGRHGVLRPLAVGSGPAVEGGSGWRPAVGCRREDRHWWWRGW
jgi:hypothetical protein